LFEGITAGDEGEVTAIYIGIGTLILIILLILLLT
jgi:hypothetical protein